MSLRELLTRPYVTNWLLAIFTGALVAVAIYQYVVVSGQLEMMRSEQRAWLEFHDPDNDLPISVRVPHAFAMSIKAGQPVTYPLDVINIGKTPARNIAVHTFVLILNDSQEPPLDYVEHGDKHPHQDITAGIMFPNRAVAAKAVRITNGGIPVPATACEENAVANGKAYVVVFGIITYDDSFNGSHWTRFCTWDALDPSFESNSSRFNARKCAEYNAGN